MLTNEESDQDWRLIMLTPEQAQKKYQESMEFINEYMTNTFSLDTFTPALKNAGEQQFYLLQFAINFLHNFPDVSAQNKALLVTWALQIAFWMGYSEGSDRT